MFVKRCSTARAAMTALTMAVWSLGCAAGALGQNATAPSSKLPLVLVPYEEPESGDPHAKDVTTDLVSEFAQNGIAVKTVDPMDHIDAVAQAAKLCEANGAGGLLIPQGRYEQTLKIVQVPFVGQIISYPTHIELRLDRLDCNGIVLWSQATAVNESRSGVIFNPGNVGSIIDDAFRKAAHELAALSGAPAPAPLARAAPGPTVAANTSIGAGPYFLVPFEQPGIADPRNPDMTRSLAKDMLDRKLPVNVGEPIDHLTIVAQAATLCAHASTTAVIVPEVRVEQTKGTHAELRLTALSCDGRIIAHARNTADLPDTYSTNRGAAMVEVTERASGGAIDQLSATLGTPASR